MGKRIKKIKGNITKDVIKKELGKIPKQRCPYCHQFTLFGMPDDKKESKRPVCVLCCNKGKVHE